MTFDEYQEQVSQYIDGELNDGDSGTLFKHLSTCGECRSFLRSTLELRSKIHDEMLMEQEMQMQTVQTKGLSFSFLLPLAALVLSLLLVFEIAESPAEPQYKPAAPSIYDAPYTYPPTAQPTR